MSTTKVVKDFFENNSRRVTVREFRAFWRSLTKSEREELKRAAERELSPSPEAA